MIEKEYYRLDELAPLGVTEGTVRYFVEQNKLTPVFFAPATTYLVGGYIDNKFHGFAVASYRGLVSLPKRCLSELLKKGKTRTNNINLIQKDNIVIKSADYPFTISYPNDYLQSWLNYNPVKSDWHSVPAKHYPTEQASGWSIMADFLKSFSDNEEQKAAFDKTYSVGKPTKVLSSYGVEFSLKDLCIRHQDLVSLGVITTKSDLAEPKQLAKKVFDGNDFEKLLAKIITSDKSLSAKPIFKILVNECNLEEDSRQFDTDGVLLEHVEGIIVWKDVLSRTKEKKCSLSTLNNKLTKVRQMLSND